MATAHELIQDARSFANNVMGQAQSWLGNAVSIAASYYTPVSKEIINVQNLDVTGFQIGEVPTFSETFSLPGGQPTMGSLSTLYVPSLPSFGAAPAPLNTSNLFQAPTPTFDLPEFDGTFPDINTEWDIPVAPVIAYPEAPVIAPLDIAPVDLQLPTILDPETFAGEFQAPVGNVGTLDLEPAYLPQNPVMPDAPSALDTSGLFQTLKPTFELGAFDVAVPDVNTSFQMPAEPSLAFPDAPTLAAVTAPDVDIALPTLDDPSAFTGGYTAPDSAPEAPDLAPYQAPDAVTFPAVPAALDPSGKFAADRPAWNLAEFSGTEPVIDTNVAFPDAPDIEFPDAPVPTAVTISDPSIALPEIADAPGFDGQWTAPVTAPADPALEPLERPEAVAFPAVPDALDPSGKFQAPRPEYTLGELTAQPPEVNTQITLPTAPEIQYPDAPTITPVTLTEPSVLLPDISDPEAFTGTYTAPATAPDAPAFEALSLPELPVFGEAPPALDTGGLFQFAAPAWTVGELGATAPEVNTQFPLPDAPDITFPAAPTLNPLSLGEAPAITLPTFDAAFAGQDPVAPELTQTFETQASGQRTLLQAFVNDQLATWTADYAIPTSSGTQQALADKLAAGLAGGTGLSDTFETQLYSRARARIDAEQAAASAQITAALAKRGYVYPPGAMTGALNALTRDYANRLAAAAQETAIERAKMEQQHAQFIISTASALHQAAQQAAVGYAGILVQINGQAVDYAKLFVAQLVEVYNGALELYKAKLSLWQTQAQVYETQLKAALAGLDKYRLELEAAKARKDIDALEVQLYDAQLGAEVRKLEVYSTQVNAVKIAADLERMKIELFNGQVEAYLGQVKAQEAKFGAYRAAIEGDTAKVQGYLAQVEGYKAGVDAEGKKADVGIARSRAVVDYNAGLSDQYRAGLARYQADIDAEKARFGAVVDAYRAGLDGYQAALRARIERLNAEIEQAKLNLETARTRKDLDRAEVELYTARLQALVTRAQIYEAQLKGVTTQLDAEKIKLELYDSEVKAYLAQAEAQQGKFQAFKTLMDADSAIVGAGAEAYRAEVDAVAKQADIGLANAKLVIEHNQSRHEVYRSQLERYRADIQAEQARMGALVDVYRAGLDAYQAAVRAKLDRVNAEIEQAKLALETVKTRKDVDQMDVQIYTARVQALMTKAEIYATQLKGVTTRLDAEKLKIDVYDGQIKAYAAQADAQQGKFQAFKSLIDADSAIVAAGGEAYRLQVDAAAKQADAGIETAKLTFAYNKELNERYAIGLDRYKTDIQAEQARLGALVDVYRAGLDGYRAALDAKLQKVKAEIEQAGLNIELVKTRKDLNEVDVRLYTAMTEAQAKRLEVYVAQLDAVKTQAEVEKTKIEVYDSQVKAFHTRAQAEEAKFNAFKTATDADVARLQGYGIEIDAYKAKVDAAGRTADIEIAHSKAVNDNNQALIAAYSARLDGYRVDIEAERTRFGAAVDAYRASLEGYRLALEGKLKLLDAEIKEAELNLEQAKTQTVVDRAQVDVFTARLDGLRSQVAVYAAQVDAVKSRADIERFKVDLFDGKVKAFLGAVTGEKAKFEAYQAAVQGDIARVQGYSAQVDAYRAGVEAEAKKADVDRERGRMIMESNRNVIEQYKAELEAYKAKLETELVRFGGHADAYKTLLSSYQAQLSAKGQVLDAQVKAKGMEVEIARLKADANLRVNMTNAQLAQKGLEMTTHAAIAAGQVSGHMAQAALSGLNALAVVDAEDATQ